MEYSDPLSPFVGKDIANEIRSYFTLDEIYERTIEEGITSYWINALSLITSSGKATLIINDDHMLELLKYTHLVAGTFLFNIDTEYGLSTIIDLLSSWLTGKYKLERGCLLGEESTIDYTFIFDGVAVKVNDDTLEIIELPAIYSSRSHTNYADFISAMDTVITICNLQLPLSHIADLPYLPELSTLWLGYDVEIDEVVGEIADLMFNQKVVETPDGKEYYGEQIADYMLIDYNLLPITSIDDEQSALYEEITNRLGLGYKLSYIAAFIPLAINSEYLDDWIHLLPDLEYIRLWGFDIIIMGESHILDYNKLGKIAERFPGGIEIVLSADPETLEGSHDIQLINQFMSPLLEEQDFHYVYFDDLNHYASVFD